MNKQTCTRAPKRGDEKRRGNALTRAWLHFMNNSNPCDFWEKDVPLHPHAHTHSDHSGTERKISGECVNVCSYVRLNLWYLSWAPFLDSFRCWNRRLALHVNTVYPASSHHPPLFYFPLPCSLWWTRRTWRILFCPQVADLKKNLCFHNGYVNNCL